MPGRSCFLITGISLFYLRMQAESWTREIGHPLPSQLHSCHRTTKTPSSDLSQAGGQQRVESGDTALFHNRDIHAAHQGRLTLRPKEQITSTEVVVLLVGTCSG